MAERTNTEIVEGIVAAFNAHDPDGLDEFVAPDVVIHGAGGQGLEGMKDDVRGSSPRSRTPTPSSQDVFDLGDKVVFRDICGGTNTGEFFGGPPTGRTLSYTEIAALRIEGGKAAEIWYFLDERQLQRSRWAWTRPRSRWSEPAPRREELPWPSHAGDRGGRRRATEAFVGELFMAGLGAFELLNVYIGDRLGLYRPLDDRRVRDDRRARRRGRDRPSATRGSGSSSRPAAGVLEVDDAGAAARADRRYSLPPAHAEALAEPGQPVLDRAARPDARVDCAGAAEAARGVPDGRRRRVVGLRRRT